MTSFDTIYERAVFKFTDYSFLDTNTELKKAILQKYLLSAITDFQDESAVDIKTYDLTNGNFTNDLGDIEIEILSLGVAYYWLRAKALNSQLLKNAIHNKDYASYSPANLLKEVRELRDSIKREYLGKIKNYSFKNGNIDSLKV